MVISKNGPQNRIESVEKHSHLRVDSDDVRETLVNVAAVLQQEAERALRDELHRRNTKQLNNSQIESLNL